MQLNFSRAPPGEGGGVVGEVDQYLGVVEPLGDLKP